MPFSLVPDRLYPRYTDVTPQLLGELGIRLLLCDLDYTLAPRSVAEPDGTLIRSGEVRATEVVNVRASDSEQADRIGKLQTGDVLEALESRANGWTKVNYNGKEGFVKSEYLEPVGEDLENAGEGDVSGADGGEDTGASAALPASGTVMVAETVNVRKSPDEKAERIGVCYQGGRLEILMQQADGWTKVKFEGKTGYVKTAVLKIVK